jgi:FimV-like protein
MTERVAIGGQSGAAPPPDPEDSSMIRKFFRYWLIAALLGPNSALALNVGEIQVQSALNQLFDARIPLPSLTPEQLNRISVKLAPPAMFEEFGLDHASILKHLVFSLQYDADGEVYVKVISTQPIREPSLALLLEFGWPRGRTFREYTVLLDPVRRLAARPQDRTLTVLDSPDETGTTLDAVATAETTDWTGEWWFPPETPSTSTPAYQPGDTYGPVAPGEGLWGIALKVRPDPNITREHMMQALFEANPQAFTSAGVNGLRSGVLLRIPTFQEIADLTGSTAARQRAEAEQPTMLAARDAATSIPEESAGLADGDLQVFPLAPVPVFEPAPVETPSPAAPDESLAVESEPTAPEPVSVSVPVPESEPAPKSEPAVMEESEPEPAVMEESEPEPAVMEESEPEPAVMEESEPDRSPNRPCLGGGAGTR